MTLQTERPRPASWGGYIAGKRGWLAPFMAPEWCFSWLAYGLSRWSFIAVLEYLGTFSVLVAVIFYFRESGDRLKQKHYQAWQVINTAQHMGGSGGRIDALSELNADGVPLVGVNVGSAFLQGVQLGGAKLLRSTFTNADVRNSNLESADLSFASLNGANFRQSNLKRTLLVGAILDDGDFCSAQFGGADLSEATLDGADLGNADLADIKWQQIKSIRKTNVAGVKHAPSGFLDWAQSNGAIKMEPNPGCPVSDSKE